MSRKLVVYLGDLSHSRFGFSPSTVPLAAGYLKAYAVQQLSGIEMEIKLFRCYDQLYAAMHEQEPDIVGCSWYGWNRWLTPEALTDVKKRFPKVLTAVGGANVPDKPEDILRDLKAFPSMDLFIPNEAEIPFVNLLKSYLAGGREAVFKAPIPGVFYRGGNNGDMKLVGEPVPVPKAIDEFPSPYLGGYLDDFLRNEELMPIVQTSRGCPFKCTFCVAAKDAWNKVRGFEIGRVKAEIDYLQAHAKNRAIRLTDENWGILPRDLEVAKYLAVKRAEAGYPTAFRSYTHKDVNDTIKGITQALSELIPVNISIQTLTDSVVENIKRHNVTLDKFRESVEWAHKHNLNVTTELIFGLPGESYASFMKVIDALLNLRIDSISIATLMMLKETEVVRPEIMSKHGYRIMHGVSERGYTKVNGFDSIETDAFAVESNDFTFEDYVRAQLFIVIFQLFMFCGYLKEMVYVWLNRGVKVSDVVTELINHPEQYPFFGKQTQRLRECLEANLFNTREEACEAFRKIIARPDAEQYIGFMSPFALPKIMSGDLVHSSNHGTMLDETIRAAGVLFAKSGTGEPKEFEEEVRFAKELALKVVIPYWGEMPQEAVEVNSPYDLVEWRNQDYEGTLSQYKMESPKTYHLTIHSPAQYREFIKEFGGLPFYRQSEAFFRTFRTNNIRRYIPASDRDQRRGKILGNTARDGDDS